MHHRSLLLVGLETMNMSWKPLANSNQSAQNSGKTTFTCAIDLVHLLNPCGLQSSSTWYCSRRLPCLQLSGILGMKMKPVFLTASNLFIKPSLWTLRTRSFYGEIFTCNSIQLRKLKVTHSALTAENPKSNSGLLHKVFNPLPSQIRRRREVPRRALIYLLSQRRDWHLSRKAIKELAEADTPLEVEQYQGLPSQSQ